VVSHVLVQLIPRSFKGESRAMGAIKRLCEIGSDGLHEGLLCNGIDAQIRMISVG
jgi:hypothetical protein